MQQDASLDTSFWNIAAQVGVAPYLFSYFTVHYCAAVEQEIVATNPSETPLIFPQAMLFQVLQEDGRLHQAEPATSERLYGPGEARAIALARERSWVLLINDYRPLQFAQSLGVQCVTVPGFCVLLYADGKITLSATLGYLRRLAPTTSPQLIRQAEAIVDRVARERGELT